MAIPGYNDKQMQAAELLYSSVEGGIEQDTIDEIVGMLADTERRVVVTDEKKRDARALLKLTLQNETDWRKRAAISAMIISNDLETA